MRTDIRVYLPSRLCESDERVVLRVNDVKNREIRTFTINSNGCTSIPDEPVFAKDPIVFLQAHDKDGRIKDLTSRARLSSALVLRTLDPKVLLEQFDASSGLHRQILNAFQFAQWISDDRIRLWLRIISTKFLRLRLPNSGMSQSSVLSVILSEVDSGSDTDEVTDLLLYFKSILEIRKVLAEDPGWRAVAPEANPALIHGLKRVARQVEHRRGLMLVQSLAVGLMDVTTGRATAASLADDVRRRFAELENGAETGSRTYGTVGDLDQPLRVEFTDLVGETVKSGREELTILYSGNPDFIRAYAARIFFFMTVFPEYHYHFALVGEETECRDFAEELNSLWRSSAEMKRQGPDGKLSISFTTLPEDLPQPMSFLASARFYFVKKCLLKFPKGLWVHDVDLYPENDFRPSLKRIPRGTDIGVSVSNFLAGVVPWKRVLAGNLLAYPTIRAKEFFEHAVNYLDFWLTEDGSWMVDQNALAYALEQTQGLVVHDFMSNGMPLTQSAMASLLESTVNNEQNSGE